MVGSGPCGCSDQGSNCRDLSVVTKAITLITVVLSVIANARFGQEDRECVRQGRIGFSFWDRVRPKWVVEVWWTGVAGADLCQHSQEAGVASYRSNEYAGTWLNVGRCIPGHSWLRIRRSSRHAHRTGKTAMVCFRERIPERNLRSPKHNRDSCSYFETCAGETLIFE